MSVKRKRVISDSESELEIEPINEQDFPSGSDDDGKEPDDVSMKSLLNRIEALSKEGQAERERMARQSQEDRRYFQAALAAIHSGPTSDSDDRGTVSPAVASVESSTETRGELPTGRNAIQALRGDARSVRVASAVLQTNGPVSEEHGKRLKSGYNMTINDHATVVAQWPQMNVYRAPNDTATYDSLSINEFCNGFLLYVHDCLSLPKPDVVNALDYLDYLRDLLDDIPLMGWEGVRDAHGEILRSIEQGRLTWTNVPARSKAIGKALRRAHMAYQAAGGTGGDSSASPNASKKSSKSKTEKPCPDYQIQDCEFKSNHSSDGTLWLHCCATCLRVRRQRYTHPKAECNRQKSLDDKSTVPKN